MVSFETEIELRKIKLLDYFWLLSDFGESIIQSIVSELPMSTGEVACGSNHVPLTRRLQLTCE